MRFPLLAAAASALVAASLLGAAEEKKTLTAEEKAALAAGDKEMKRQHEEAVKKALDDFKQTLREAKTPGERAAAVWKLGEAERDPRIASEIARFLGEAESRGEAMSALGKYRRDKTAAQVLIGALASGLRNPIQTERCLSALASVGHESAAPAVAKVLNDKDDRVSAAAVHALGETNCAAAVDPLILFWEELEKNKKKDGDIKRFAEEKLKLVTTPLKEALAKLTDQKLAGPEEYRAWWAQNRSAFKPKVETPPILCRHADPVYHPFLSAPPGTILREVWTGVGGGKVEELTRNERFKGPPNSTTLVSSFEIPRNTGDDYGTRVRGFLIPPADGGYQFWIAADDDGELFLSPDDDPSRKVPVCRPRGSRGVRDVYSGPEQQSKFVQLSAGRRYYIEALHKEGGGDDHLCVAWTKPGTSVIEVIPGKHLAAFASREEAAGLKVLPPVEENLLIGPTPGAPIVAGAPGTILREVWTGIGGGGIGDLVNSGALSRPPNSSSQLTSFESPNDDGNDYGCRVRGLLLPAVEGEYVFWIASDDSGVLYLGTDDSPGTKVQIARVPQYCGRREWTKFPEQQSKPVRLAAGRRYYIEAQHKQGGGGSNLSVAWQPPGGQQEVIPGRFLAPAAPAGGAPATAVAAGGGTPAVALPKPVGTFFRAVNLNGPALTLDGMAWEAGADAENVLAFGQPFSDPALSLSPPDDARAPMLRTALSNYGRLGLVLGGVPSGTYDVYLYLVEIKGGQSFTLQLEGAAVATQKTCPAGQWQRLGPWTVTVTDNALHLSCTGDAVNLCGIEVWKK
jgi:hypothetical protein